MYYIYDFDKISCVMKSKYKSVPDIYIEKFIKKDKKNVLFFKKTKDKNFVFSKAIDLIYESFNLNKNFQNKSFSKILKSIGKNENLNNYFIKLADTGINF